jgi:hypothetical protein
MWRPRTVDEEVESNDGWNSSKGSQAAFTGSARVCSATTHDSSMAERSQSTWSLLGNSTNNRPQFQSWSNFDSTRHHPQSINEMTNETWTLQGQPTTNTANHRFSHSQFNNGFPHQGGSSNSSFFRSTPSSNNNAGIPSFLNNDTNANSVLNAARQRLFSELAQQQTAPHHPNVIRQQSLLSETVASSDIFGRTTSVSSFFTSSSDFQLTRNSPIIGNNNTSELYRLIVTGPPPQSASHAADPTANYWDSIIRRATDYPCEACFYDSNAGGHVYALHRLLRCNRGIDSMEGNSNNNNNNNNKDDDGHYRAPLSVVEAVMRACPRALTRKQAVVDEDVILIDAAIRLIRDRNHDNNISNNGDNIDVDVIDDDNRERRRRIIRPDNNDDNDDEEADDDDAETTSHRDDVRFEYPLAIACEFHQDPEVIRLLASHLGFGDVLPAYRSEVFRSLDYVSLPNHIVRILLEEHPGCVIERGTNSEVTEGDDDDCPLEQVLFWWDDPDMMGIESEVQRYPNCDMADDLRDLYEKLRMMLYAAITGSMMGYDGPAGLNFQVFHHILRIVSYGRIGNVRIPNDFAHAALLLSKFIQREHRAMFEERDEKGSLPLHIAVSGDSLLRQKEEVTEEVNTNVNDGEILQDENTDLVQEDDDNDEELQRNAPGPLPPAAQIRNDGDEDDSETDEVDSEADIEEGVEDVDRSTTSSSDMEIIRLLLDQHPESIRLRDSQTGSLPIHLLLQHNPLAIDAIGLLLDRFPRSVTMPNGNGRLPIHLAIIHQSPTWNKILDMSHIGLEARDPETGLLPFQLAAMMSRPVPPTGNEHEELESFTTCFRLLRMNPCLASGLAEIKPRGPHTSMEQKIMVSYKPRVTKLEEENERLRQRVEELELKLASIQLVERDDDTNGCPSQRPILKKRKSQL